MGADSGAVDGRGVTASPLPNDAPQTQPHWPCKGASNQAAVKTRGRGGGCGPDGLTTHPPQPPTWQDHLIFKYICFLPKVNTNISMR